MSANEKQVGGLHYQAELQHWDLIEENGIGYLEGCATKYVTRWRKKNGRQDLEKALHYTDKLIELNEAGLRDPRGRVDDATVKRFAKANGLTEIETTIIKFLVQWEDPTQLLLAKLALKELIEEVEKQGGA